MDAVKKQEPPANFERITELRHVTKQRCTKGYADEQAVKGRTTVVFRLDS